MISDLKCHDSPVIEVKDSAEIDFVDFYSYVILEFCYIRKPFFVRGIRTKFPIQVILGDMIRVVGILCTALGAVLD